MEKQKHARSAREAGRAGSEDADTKQQLAQVKDDLESLYTHVGDIVRDGTDGARANWAGMQKELEAKRAAMVVRAQRLKSAGAAASSELKEGFESAYKEMKEAIQDARDKFA